MDKTEYMEWRSHADFIRSNILSQVTNFENLIKQNLASRFAHEPDDIKKFNRIFLEANRLPFNSLLELYKQYLKEYEPGQIKENSEYLQTLNELKSIRNEFAHGGNALDWDVEKIEFKDAPAIKLLLNKKGKLIWVEYSTLEIQKLNDRITNLIEHFTSKKERKRNE